MPIVTRLDALRDRPADTLRAPFPRGDAAVLLLVVRPGPDEPTVAVDAHRRHGLVLTRRSADLRTDPGYVAFPGGRVDPGETPEVTALRECEEEVGIAASAVTVHGRLDETWNGAGFRIVPVVASTTGPVVLAPQEAEVSAAAVVPLDLVLAEAHHRVVDVEIDGRHFRDDVIEFDHAAVHWRLYGPTADLARDLAAWLDDGDRRQGTRRQGELDGFAAARGWPRARR